MIHGRRVVVLVAALVGAVALSGAPTRAGMLSTGNAVSGSSAPGTEPADVDRDGTLRIGLNLTPVDGVFEMDPGKTPRQQTSWSFARLVYDSLLHLDPTNTGALLPGLATEWEVVDPRTIDLTLREGVTFQDGTPFDAEAVKFNLLRNRDAANPILRPEIGAIEDVEVTGPLTLTIHMNQDWAGAFLPQLASLETIIASPTAAAAGTLSEEPVGAGPYRLVSVTPEDSVVLERWDGYYGADDIRVKTIEYVHVPPGPMQVSALQGDVVDFLLADPLLLESFAGLDDLTVQVETGMLAPRLSMCKSEPPFDDVRVRQAINYAIDRDAMLELAFGGEGEPMWTVFPQNHPLYDPRWEDHYAFDPEEAQRLLSEAGYEDGLSFDLVAQNSPEGLRLSEIFQSQMAAVGIDVTIKETANLVEDFYTNPIGDAAFTAIRQDGIDRVAVSNINDVIWNVCGWAEPELQSLIDQLRAIDPASDEAHELWMAVQENLIENAVMAYGVYSPEVNVWQTDRVGGVQTYRDSVQALSELDIRSVYVRN